eukprot:TRINITY_DN835_c0_g1_i12.p1 TRINITY_DN835_c0_g1~~TRINITY_DN835_c0_g1_i12.p1  ORF type:complete len:205 (+),score=60.35 TRINITY_DN835_c0_g1_i12:49-615(+)
MGCQWCSHFSTRMNPTILSFLALASLSVVSGHTTGTDVMAYFEAYRAAGSTCNKNRPVTGWTVVVDRSRDAVGAATNNAAFSAGTGTYTTPQAGVYHCCASFRCQQGGVCDWTVIRNGGAGDVVWGAFGTRNTNPSSRGWASHAHCWTSRCGAGVTWKLNLESGGSTDCIQETQWRYGKFTCFLTSPN